MQIARCSNVMAALTGGDFGNAKFAGAAGINSQNLGRSAVGGVEADLTGNGAKGEAARAAVKCGAILASDEISAIACDHFSVYVGTKLGVLFSLSAQSLQVVQIYQSYHDAEVSHIALPALSEEHFAWAARSFGVASDDAFANSMAGTTSSSDALASNGGSAATSSMRFDCPGIHLKSHLAGKQGIQLYDGSSGQPYCKHCGRVACDSSTAADCVAGSGRNRGAVGGKVESMDTPAAPSSGSKVGDSHSHAAGGSAAQQTASTSGSGSGSLDAASIFCTSRNKNMNTKVPVALIVSASWDGVLKVHERYTGEAKVSTKLHADGIAALTLSSLPPLYRLAQALCAACSSSNTNGQENAGPASLSPHRRASRDSANGAEEKIGKDETAQVSCSATGANALVPVQEATPRRPRRIRSSSDVTAKRLLWHRRPLEALW